MWSDEYCSGEFMCKKVMLKLNVPSEGVAGMLWSKRNYFDLEMKYLCASKQMPKWSYGVHMSK